MNLEKFQNQLINKKHNKSMSLALMIRILQLKIKKVFKSRK